MASNKREACTLIFFTSFLGTLGLSVGFTRIALRMKFDSESVVAFCVGGIFFILSILILGTED